MAEIDRRRSYFHPERGWSDDPEGATLRVDSQVRFLEKGQAQTLIYRREADGSWSIVLDNDELDSGEKAYLWQTWKTRAAGQDMMAFRGLRAIDSETSRFLVDLVPHDLEGNPLSDPEDAGFLFLLSDHDAREFSRRVMKEERGTVEIVKATDGRPQALIERLRKEREVVEKARALDQDSISRGRDGDFSGLPSFRGRTDQLRERFSVIGRLVSELELSVSHLRNQDRTEEERVLAEQLVREAKRIKTAVQSERGSRDEEAAELDYLQAVALGNAPAFVEKLRRSVALEVGLAAKKKGFPVQETADGVRIALPGGQIITIGPGFEIN
jgi:hypothetical protein